MGFKISMCYSTIFDAQQIVHLGDFFGIRNKQFNFKRVLGHQVVKGVVPFYTAYACQIQRGILNLFHEQIPTEIIFLLSQEAPILFFHDAL
jgi:hypothetical protein